MPESEQPAANVIKLIRSRTTAICSCTRAAPHDRAQPPERVDRHYRRRVSAVRMNTGQKHCGLCCGNGAKPPG